MTDKVSNTIEVPNCSPLPRRASLCQAQLTAVEDNEKISQLCDLGQAFEIERIAGEIIALSKLNINFDYAHRTEIEHPGMKRASAWIREELSNREKNLGALKRARAEKAAQ